MVSHLAGTDPPIPLCWGVWILSTGVGDEVARRCHHESRLTDLYMYSSQAEIRSVSSYQPLRLCRFGELSSNLQQIRQFVLDELDRLEDLGLGAGAGNHHLAAAKYQADDLGVVESVD